MKDFSDSFIKQVATAYIESVGVNDGLADYLLSILQEIGVFTPSSIDKSCSNSMMVTEAKHSDYGVKGMKWGVRKERLSKKDLDALTRYKSSESYKINAKLRDGGYDALPDPDKAFVDQLDAALKKMPHYEGPIIRDLLIDDPEELSDFLSKHPQDGLSQYEAYSSFSKKPGYNPDANVHLVVQHSKNARDISNIGLNENEVIYERGARFHVSRIIQSGNQWYIMEEEVNG